MSKKGRGSVWWWLLLLVVSAGIIGYYLTNEKGRTPETETITKKPSPVERKAGTQERPKIIEEERGPLADVTEEKNFAIASAEEDDCSQIEKNMTEFFHYLDHKNYVQHLDPEMDTCSRVRGILKRLANRPPIPAGEGVDPKIIIQNVYHLFRVLDRKDLRLLREIITNEEDSLEANLEMFYTWHGLGDSCPALEELRLPLNVLYQYAGFFLNTIGGRGCLFRRPSRVRLLASYYCLLIVHEADKAGRNNYGIDVFPFITPLRAEISHCADIQFQSKYIEQLNRIENYYLAKR
jgi:hypothetical protein